MKPYVHTVRYYETDMMGMAHHSNYIRWMEEARIDLMDKLGFPYRELEEKGIVSPVRSISCEYRRPCTFGDEVFIRAAVGSFNGVILTILYDMRDREQTILCTARSEHVFLDREKRLVRMDRAMPDLYAAIVKSMEQGGGDAL